MKAARHEKNGAMMATCMEAAALPCLTCSQHLSRFLLYIIIRLSLVTGS